MAQSFEHNLRALDAERSTTVPWAALLLALFCAIFAGWFFGARVDVLVSVDDARLEAREAGHKLQAQVSGYVVAVHEQLDRPVERGEILIELDDSSERREWEQKSLQLEAAVAQLAALRLELRALEDVRAGQRSLRHAHDAEAAVRALQADATAVARERERDRDARLLELGAVSPLAADQSRSLADRERHEALASLAARRRISADQGLLEAEHTQRSAQMQKELALAEAEQASIRVRLLELETVIERRKVRAPVAGRMGTIAPVTVGSFVTAGDALGTVIPNGGLRIVALVPPERALGLLRQGQRGTLQLVSFPWTEFGSLRGTIERVGREVHDGRVRVELGLNAPFPARIPLQHGLPGK
ncbi:MAG TPA: HlyD family efflux transporter periplasmic adaptor subunit, partial [Polyangiales bacterium]|nr:HlyD family efflux transporter periplasmic adaptor subunit [Polyangiales bacterium]